jgi:N6-L-threonylcarbamoyladenine synthase
MHKKITFLGIETSCDETAAAIIEQNKNGKVKILSNVVSSQIEQHKKFGGVVPELAARAHAENIDIVIKKAIKDSKINLKNIDGVATTAGPGLLVCLTVGMTAGKTIALSLNKPFYPINHLEGHALTMGIFKPISFPYLLLLISGGHSQFLSVNGIGKYKRLGTTIDDALGEAFDKTAKILGIEFPGGPKLEQFAKKGNPNTYDLPKPILYRGGCNMSFAGLKTAILLKSKEIKKDQEKFDLAASFQKTICEILKVKCKVAMEMFIQQNKNSKSLNFVVAGGVAANETVRKTIQITSEQMNFQSHFPPIQLCTDNAAMIAWAGIKQFEMKKKPNLNLSAQPRWPLDKRAPFMKGAGIVL